MAVSYFPAIVEGGNTPGYSVFFPDLLGCVSAGDTVQEAVIAAEEALRGHLEAMVRDGETIPAQRSLDEIEHDPDVIEAARVLVRAELPGRSVRFNVTMDERLLAEVDKEVTIVGTTRSGFIADTIRARLLRRPVVVFRVLRAKKGWIVRAEDDDEKYVTEFPDHERAVGHAAIAARLSHAGGRAAIAVEGEGENPKLLFRPGDTIAVG